MTRLFLVRHGQPLARYDQDHDPGLDDVGRAQAETAARELSPLGPLPVVTSPLRRTRETAAPFERQWSVTASVQPAVGEIKVPSEDLGERSAWLVEILRGERRWQELDADRRSWRDGVVDALLELDTDTVVVTHYIAINAAVGAATGDDRVLNFRPDNCSCTVLETDGRRLTLIERGRERETAVT
ncbi:MAG: histidine phosphatase family protein [Acidimicrobiia bacterium]|nr:histidine phosphatase family protein [Acidimicrobiia bacterium]